MGRHLFPSRGALAETGGGGPPGPWVPLPSQAGPGNEYQTGKRTHHPLTYREPGNVPAILGWGEDEGGGWRANLFLLQSRGTRFPGWGPSGSLNPVGGSLGEYQLG